MADLDTCEAWDVFKAKLSEIQNRHIPLKHKRNRTKLKPAWLTPEVRSAIQAKKAV